MLPACVDRQARAAGAQRLDRAQQLHVAAHERLLGDLDDQPAKIVCHTVAGLVEHRHDSRTR
jgi:hypothetical protein